jgi:murein DD-endopeptidase MepM/ murein hydrolase activator NlpD
MSPRRAAWLLGLLLLAGCGGISYDGIPTSRTPAPPAMNASLAGGQTYRVVAGDTIDGVAQQFGLPVQALIQANGLAMPYELRPGQLLAIPGTQPAGAGPGVYVVARGDTLYRIARHHGTTMATLAQLNGLAPPYRLRVGQTLRLPGAPPLQTASAAPAEYVAMPPAMPAPAMAPAMPGPSMAPAGSSKLTTESLAPPPGIAAAPAPASSTAAPAPAPAAGPSMASLPTPAPAVAGPAAAPASPSAGPTPQALSSAPLSSPAPAATTSMTSPPLPAAAESAIASATIEPPAGQASLPAPAARGSGKFLWPVSGKIVSPFGPKEGGLHNDGINVAAPLGTPVRAAENGVVVYAGNELRGFGNLLLVRHADGWVSAYAHCDALLVKRGDQVKRGQVIARVGQTGSVGAPQLHFELRKSGQAVDPLNELGPQGA